MPRILLETASTCQIDDTRMQKHLPTDANYSNYRQYQLEYAKKNTHTQKETPTPAKHIHPTKNISEGVDLLITLPPLG